MANHSEEWGKMARTGLIGKGGQRSMDGLVDCVSEEKKTRTGEACSLGKVAGLYRR